MKEIKYISILSNKFYLLILKQRNSRLIDVSAIKINIYSSAFVSDLFVQHLWHLIISFSFLWYINLQEILVKEQQWHFLIDSWKDNRVYNFLKDINLKVNLNSPTGGRTRLRHGRSSEFLPRRPSDIWINFWIYFVNCIFSE